MPALLVVSIDEAFVRCKPVTIGKIPEPDRSGGSVNEMLGSFFDVAPRETYYAVAQIMARAPSTR